MFFNKSSKGLHEFPFSSSTKYFFLVQCLVNFRILKKTYADTVATGILVVVEEFFGLKLGNSTIEVEVCGEFFSVSVDTVPQIHISKQ